MIKKEITKMQIDNNIKPSFYTVFESMIDEETKETLSDKIIREQKEKKSLKR